MVRQGNTAYVDEELFFEYILNVLIPDVDTVRSRPGQETETAILLMDSALPPTSPEFGFTELAGKLSEFRPRTNCSA
jgi:hypothetical protein